VVYHHRGTSYQWPEGGHERNKQLFASKWGGGG
jgi:hypothetical protein